MLEVKLTQSGLPLVSAKSESGEWLTVNGKRAVRVTGHKLFRDAAAIGGETTTYRLGSESVSITATAGMGIVSAGGEFIPCRTLDRSDPVDHNPNVAIFNLASGGVAVRRPLTPPPVKVSIDLWVPLVNAERVADFARTGPIFVRAGYTGGRLPAVRLVEPSSVTTTSNPKAVLFRIEGHCAYPGVGDYPGLVAPATVGEVCRMGITCVGTMADIVHRVNGVTG